MKKYVNSKQQDVYIFLVRTYPEFFMSSPPPASMEHRAIFFGTGLGFGIAVKVAAADHAGGHLEQAGLFFRAYQQLAGAGDDAHGG